MSVTPPTDSEGMLRWPRWLAPLRGEAVDLGPVGQAVELVVARAAERHVLGQLTHARRQLISARDERDTALEELGELRVDHTKLTAERDQLDRDLAALRKDRAGISEELRQTRHDLAQAHQALNNARSIRTLCGALLHRYQPKPERGPELYVAVASASQLGYWREQLAGAVVPWIALAESEASDAG